MSGSNITDVIKLYRSSCISCWWLVGWHSSWTISMFARNALYVDMITWSLPSITASKSEDCPRAASSPVTLAAVEWTSVAGRSALRRAYQRSVDDLAPSNGTVDRCVPADDGRKCSATESHVRKWLESILTRVWLSDCFMRWSPHIHKQTHN